MCFLEAIITINNVQFYCVVIVIIIIMSFEMVKIPVYSKFDFFPLASPRIVCTLIDVAHW